MKKLLLLFAVFMLVLSSCHKDSDDERDISGTTTEQPTINNASEGLLYGIIVDENGVGLSGVTISSYGKQTTSKSNGTFEIKEALLSPTGTYVTADLDGYFLGSDFLYNGGKDGYAKIRMIKKENVKTVNSSSGGTITVDGGGEISFPTDAFVDESNQPYSGEVKVYAKRIATDDDYFYEIMPGGLYAKDNEGRNVVLGSMGMVAVELNTPSGDKLQLKEGVTARTVFPIAADQLAIAEETIELWSFDENLGLWIEEGVAIKEGNNYVGELPHFSFWNCDAPFPLIKLKGRLIDEVTGLPVTNFWVEIATPGYGIGYGRTDSEGYFCGLVPKNTDLVISSSSYECPTSVFSLPYGPFTTDTDIGDIVISSNIGVVSVLCDGQPVPNAFLTIMSSEQTNSYYLYDGTLDLNLACLSGDLTFIANDYTTGNISDPITINASDLGSSLDILVCDTECNLSMVLDNNADEVCTTDEVLLTSTVSGGSGNYSYLWASGETSQSISYTSNPDAQQVCLTVTDLDTDCSQDFCFNRPSLYRGIAAEYWFGGSCSDNISDIYIYPSGGTSPYIVEIPNLGLSVLSGDQDSVEAIVLSPIPDGTYDVVITDVNGCSTTITVTVVAAQNNNFFAEVFQQRDCQSGDDYMHIGTFGNENLPITVEVVETGQIETFNTDPALIGPLAPGTYNIVVTNNDGCTFNSEATIISESGIFSIINTQGNSLCDGPVSLNVSPYSTNYVSSVLWSTGETTSFLTVYEAGTYCATVTTSDGCEYEACIEVTGEILTPDFLDVACDNNGGYFFVYNSSEQVNVDPSDISYNDILQGDNIFNGTITLIAYNQEGCDVTIDYELTSTEALGSFTVNGLSCGTCEDGYVTWVNNSESVFCERCQFVEVRIYNLNDLSTDVFDLNESQSLPAGEYVMVGMGEEGCVTMRQEFIIE